VPARSWCIRRIDRGVPSPGTEKDRRLVALAETHRLTGVAHCDRNLTKVVEMPLLHCTVRTWARALLAHAKKVFPQTRSARIGVEPDAKERQRKGRIVHFSGEQAIGVEARAATRQEDSA
jgi:hypothetical protein